MHRIEQKKYFTINRARQYGKTTTLMLLEDRLSGAYDFIGIDFQDVTDAIRASLFTGEAVKLEDWKAVWVIERRDWAIAN